MQAVALRRESREKALNSRPLPRITPERCRIDVLGE
jgi:hypothetical protein